jgi:AICAR transformylase/IMP cyclohydrolase PurH
VHAETDDPLAIGRFELLGGSAPSYNNLAELDQQLLTITHVAAAFDLTGDGVPAIAIGTKHGNARGAAVSATPEEAPG